LLTHLIIGVVAVALQVAADPFEQSCDHLGTAAGIVVEQDDAPPGRTGYPHPHVVLSARGERALEHLHWGFIHADVTALAQPLVHQVDQRLYALSQGNDPGRLRGARQLHPVALEDGLLAVQRQRIVTGNSATYFRRSVHCG